VGESVADLKLRLRRFIFSGFRVLGGVGIGKGDETVAIGAFATVLGVLLSKSPSSPAVPSVAMNGS